MTDRARVLVPVAVIVAGTFVVAGMVATRPKAEPQKPPKTTRLVRAITLKAEPVTLVVYTQGTVAPRSEIDLVPEVSGRIIEVSSALVSGGFFAKDQVLVRLDSRDYELAVASAEAEVARAQVALAREEAEAEVARREWRDLSGSDAGAPPLVVHEPQLAEARARLAAAEASLARARLDLERTVLRAQFDGRVREEHVDVGQFVERGRPIARLYAIDVAEIRLPIANDQLAYLDLPMDASNFSEVGDATTKVLVEAEFAGETYQWEGWIVRTEGEVDAKSRMIHAVATVEDPYGRLHRTNNPPLAVGMFVHAKILGRRIAHAYVLPPIALRGGGRVAVITDDDRLEYRRVEVVRAERERVIIGSGLRDGERVCISPLDAVVDGMKVRVAETAGGADS